jgi:hypothetical protein
MVVFDESFYGWILEKIKQREQEKENALYEQIQLELPVEQPQVHIIDEQIEKKDRGVITIDLT